MTNKTKKQRENQQKLFLKFLKKEKLFGKYCSYMTKYPNNFANASAYYKQGMYYYTYVIYELFGYNEYNKWTYTQSKWIQIVDNYKLIKKKDYKIYGK